jgi:hypothetical protein
MVVEPLVLWEISLRLFVRRYNPCVDLGIGEQLACCFVNVGHTGYAESAQIHSRCSSRVVCSFAIRVASHAVAS